MADDNRPYPPSETKLRELRERGIFPWSALFCSVFSFFGLCGGLYFLWAKGTEIAPLVSPFFKAQLNYQEAIFLIGILSGLVISSVFVAVFLSSMWQSKFLFTSPFVKAPQRRGNLGRGGVLGMLFFSFGWILLGLLILSSSISGLNVEYAKGAARLYGDLAGKSEASGNSAVRIASLQTKVAELQKEATNWINREVLRYRPALFGLLSLLLLLGIVSRIRAVVSFRKLHQMSRSELEAEYRETELPSAVRTAQSELRGMDS